MALEISKASSYQKELRRADAHEGVSGYNDQIDTPAEYRQSLVNILSSLAIEKLPEQYQKLVRKQIDALGSGPASLNGIIDTSEVEKTIALLAQKYGKQALLEELVYTVAYKPAVLPPVVATKVPDINPVNAVPGSGKYDGVVNKLVKYLLAHNGNPPNAVKRFTENGKTAIAIFHNFNDSPSHIKNSGGTTSEAQVLFFNFMTLYAALSGDKKPMQEALTYIKRYMMPHDGEGSIQLPDENLRLPQWRHNPYLIHWLVDASGMARGVNVYGQNTTYNMYEPDFDDHACIAQDTNYVDKDVAGNNPTLPSVHKLLSGKRGKPGTWDSNTYKFGDASDATQWLQSGFYWATRFDLGNYQEEFRKFCVSLHLELTDKDASFPRVMQFGYYWGGNVPEQWGWSDIGRDVYAGYQDPAAWYILGKPDIAQNMVSFLSAAQKEFASRYKQEGPFMQVYNKSGFGWTGADPNTYWMGFQYRAFAHLAHYYYLTGDKSAEQVLVKFVDWVKANTASDTSGYQIPLALNNGRKKDMELGVITEKGFFPDCFGLLAQGLILMTARNKDEYTRKKAEVVLDVLVKKQTDKGVFPNPEDGFCYGFHQAEVGIAFCLYALLLEGKIK